MSNNLTTHVLDTALGRPAQGLPIELSRLDGDRWVLVGEGVTDADGRLKTLLGGADLTAGTWKIRFDTGSYFRAQNVAGFFPEATVVFTVFDPAQHHHVPLLLSPFGYSTYRGS